MQTRLAWVSGLLAAVSSCSFAIKGVDPHWDGASEPTCGSDTVWIDRLTGVLLITGAAAAAAVPDKAGVVVAVPLAIAGTVYEIAGAHGAHLQAECRLARMQWWYSTAITPTAMPTPEAPTPPPPAARPPAPSTVRPWAVGVSGAEQAIALQLYGEGNAAYAQHLYAEALARYRQAVAHWDHPAIRFNMVVCLVELAQPVEAHDSLDRSLTYGADPLGPEAYARALGYRERLDRTLVRLTLDCPEPDEEVMLDGESIFTGPGRVSRYLLPGNHQVVASKRGFLPAAKQIVLVPGQPESYQIRPLIDPRTAP